MYKLIIVAVLLAGLAACAEEERVQQVLTPLGAYLLDVNYGVHGVGHDPEVSLPPGSVHSGGVKTIALELIRVPAGKREEDERDKLGEWRYLLYGDPRPSREIWRDSDYVVKHLSDRGLRPATDRELIAFGKAFPKLKSGDTIVALGNSWLDIATKKQVVAALGGQPRVLFIQEEYSNWDPDCWFLAVWKEGGVK